MYISSVVVTFSSESDPSLLTTSLSLDFKVGCSLFHAMAYIDRNPVVKSYLNKKYRIIGLIFKYSHYENLPSTVD